MKNWRLEWDIEEDSKDKHFAKENHKVNMIRIGYGDCVFVLLCEYIFIFESYEK